VITNHDLEKLVDTNDQWIVERTGIRERHKLAKGLGVSDICVEAAKKCLAARGIEASEVEVIIVGTVTPDMMFPSTACLVQDKIGAKGRGDSMSRPVARDSCLHCRRAQSWWRAERTRKCWCAARMPTRA